MRANVRGQLELGSHLGHTEAAASLSGQLCLQRVTGFAPARCLEQRECDPEHLARCDVAAEDAL
eukprot:SAG31_NODE_9041_length_1344_cov_0.956627_2_plen_64_part_00